MSGAGDLRDYPRTLTELLDRFGDEAACEEYLEWLRFPPPRGFWCWRCGAVGKPWRSRGRLRLVCPSCRKDTWMRSGTLLDRSGTPLRTWFAVAWLMTSGKNGVSATTVARTLGVAYNTAWGIQQRLRVAMVRADRPALAGTVEADETFIGGVRHGQGRGPVGKAVVAVAVENNTPD